MDTTEKSTFISCALKFVKSDVWSERNHIPAFVYLYHFYFWAQINCRRCDRNWLLPSGIPATTIRRLCEWECTCLLINFMAHKQTESRLNVKWFDDATDDHDDGQKWNKRILFLIFREKKNRWHCDVMATVVVWLPTGLYWAQNNFFTLCRGESYNKKQKQKRPQHDKMWRDA